MGHQQSTLFDPPPPSSSTQANFDPRKFEGVWHEQARSDNPWERGHFQVKVTYQWKPDQGLVIEKKNAITDQVLLSGTGVSTQPPASKMMVRFRGRNFNYWVHRTDYTSFAIVGNGMNQVWLLSRDEGAQHDGSRWREQVLRQTRRLGYSTSGLVWNKRPVAFDLNNLPSGDSQILYQSNQIKLVKFRFLAGQNARLVAPEEQIIQGVKGTTFLEIEIGEDSESLGRRRTISHQLGPGQVLVLQGNTALRIRPEGGVRVFHITRVLNSN